MHTVQILAALLIMLTINSSGFVEVGDMCCTSVMQETGARSMPEHLLVWIGWV